jgi:hypothetical protein
VAAVKSIRLMTVLFAMWLGSDNPFNTAGRPDASASQIPMPDMTLRISDFAAVEPSVMAGARSVATDIFRTAGVNPLWFDCRMPEDDCGGQAIHPEFRVRIVSDRLVQDIAWDSALGFAIPCSREQEPCILYVLYSRIVALAAEHGRRADRILGHVIAHEVGHAVLGHNAHGLFGVMRRRLAVYEMERTLYFTPSQARRLRTEVMERNGGSDR